MVGVEVVDFVVRVDSEGGLGVVSVGLLIQGDIIFISIVIIVIYIIVIILLDIAEHVRSGDVGVGWKSGRESGHVFVGVHILAGF